MMGSDMEYPALYQLLGAYFHQDWSLDGTELGVLDTFISDEPDLARGLPREVAKTLSTNPSESELEKSLFQLGSYYAAQPADGGYRGFLERIAERASARTA